ncbi:NUDIX hydrolase [Actinocorallia sp. API 0066]|uniref:NUDIX hydrolase n=1 Tax=Actinocorallia sp. API 0066 TaxID=2896846 RepID=UPI001E2AD575|nr:NUDIX hydrolase [Actinocorallia sp. API 0066]MCD0450660.1 NUDIX hydrolase [Actinocorallia sp. API 0066]
MKAVVVDGNGRVLLLKNEREEWELPGGKLELGEEAAECAVREVAEECGWRVRAEELLDVWMYEPLPARHVFIVTYGCRLLDPDAVPRISHEHKELALFRHHEVGALVMPQGYKDSISTWFARPRAF